MILKKLMPVFAIILVLAMLSPSILAAEMQENTTIIDAPSEHADEYDEVVNIAEESSIQNPDTWEPGYYGIWAGSSTKESLFQFSDVTCDGGVWDTMAIPPNPLGDDHASMGIAWEVVFSRNQIMSGVSEFVIRLPTYNPAGLWLPGDLAGTFTDSSYITISALDDNDTYSWSRQATAPSAIFKPWQMSVPGGAHPVVPLTEINWTDASYGDGNNVWTIDGRTYMRFFAPIFPDVRYLFELTIPYAPDNKFSLFLSPQDILGDGKMNTSVAMRNYDPRSDTYQDRYADLPIDCGYSFDLLTGMGGGIFGKMFSMEAGDTIEYLAYVPQTGSITGYHNLMVPFKSDDIINASIEVECHYKDPFAWGPSYSIGAQNYKDYFLVADSDDESTSRSFYATVTITFNQPASIVLFFWAEPYKPPVWSPIIKGTQIHADIWNSYQVSATPVVASNDLTLGFPINPLPSFMVPWELLGSLVFFLVFPLVSLYVGFYDHVTNGDGVAGYLWRTAGDYIAAGIDRIAGIISNAIDKVWQFLKGIGDFLESIGEMIWHALEWLAEQIIEYGSILLGLIIIAVALMLFFYPIKWQLGFWDMVWAMASGDWKGAAKAANGLDRDISRAMRTAGKVDKRISRAGKVLSKKYTAWEKSRNDKGGEA